MTPRHCKPVLLFAFHFPPESLAGASRPYRFSRYLPEFGYITEVVTGAVQPNPVPHVHHVPAHTYIPNRYTISGAIEILLHKVALPAELALLWSIPASRVASELAATKRFAAVISTAPPINTHLAALRIKKKLGIPWIADFRDPLIGNPFRANNRFFERQADQALEALIFRNADAILAVTDVVAEDWKSRYPKWESKIHVIWNGFDPADPVAATARPAGEPKTMAHIGSLYGSRFPTALLRSFQRLLAANKIDRAGHRIRFVGQVSQDVSPDGAQALSELQAMNIIEQVGSVSRDLALQYTAAADSLLLLDITGRDTGASNSPRPSAPSLLAIGFPP